MVSLKIDFPKVIDEAFGLIFKEEKKEVAEPAEFPDALSRAPEEKHHHVIPESFPLLPSKDGKPRSITREQYVKAIHSAATLDDQMFQTQNEHHLNLVAPLYRIFREIDSKELIKFLRIARAFVKNKDVLRHAFLLALQRRKDFHVPTIPAQITYAPHMYFNFGGLKYEPGEDGCLTVRSKFDYHCDSNVDLEARVEYFRCDPGICAHHKHWHEAYMDVPPSSDLFIAGEKSHRGGELFYYMHSQMLARYNFERLSVHLPITEPLTNLHEPLPEGHFNKLTTAKGEKLWDSRAPNTRLRNINIEGFGLIKVTDLELARDRIYDAIDRGFCFEKKIINGKVTESLEPLNAPYVPPETEEDELLDYGIDKLGDMVWSYPPRSVNFSYYKGLHNDGHLMVSFCHDPEGLYHRASGAGVMSSNETAVRDAAFFTWHAFVDEVFQRYKCTLPEYDIEKELGFEKITIDELAIEQPGVAAQGSLPVLQTKWFVDRVDITLGMSPEVQPWVNTDKVWYEYIHLGHDAFNYKFTVTNANEEVKYGTVRIFMAPYYMSRYRSKPPVFNDLRKMFIELDKFVVKLNPGKNEFERPSTKSSVTVPLEQLFMTSEQAMKLLKNATVKVEESWCGCGWPDYFLIGRGTKEGLRCRLFVMITDYKKDVTDPEEETTSCCKMSMSYCGRRNKRYPDRKPMGFPFDRNIANAGMSLEGFMTKTRNEKEQNPEFISNMKKIDFIVQHVGEPENPLPGPTIPKSS